MTNANAGFENLKRLTGPQLHAIRLDAAHMHAAPGNRVAEYRAAIEREYERRIKQTHEWNPTVYGERV